jgi:hypothetical protein
MGGVNYALLNSKMDLPAAVKWWNLFKSTSKPIQRNDFGFDLINEL